MALSVSRTALVEKCQKSEGCWDPKRKSIVTIGVVSVDMLQTGQGPVGLLLTARGRFKAESE